MRSDLHDHSPFGELLDAEGSVVARGLAKLRVVYKKRN
jgi:hypothetical protein